MLIKYNLFFIIYFLSLSLFDESERDYQFYRCIAFFAVKLRTIENT